MDGNAIDNMTAVDGVCDMHIEAIIAREEVELDSRTGDSTFIWDALGDI
jgi:hypothetical protein